MFTVWLCLVQSCNISIIASLSGACQIVGAVKYCRSCITDLIYSSQRSTCQEVLQRSTTIKKCNSKLSKHTSCQTDRSESYRIGNFETGGDIYWQIDKPWWVDQYSNFIIQSPSHTFQCHFWRIFFQAERQYTTLFLWGGRIRLKFLGCFFKVNIDWRWSDSTAAATELFPPPFPGHKYSIQNHLKLLGYSHPTSPS